MSSNLLAIFTMPFALALCLGCGGGVHLPPGPLLRSLAQCILAPVLVGHLARRSSPPLAAWVAQHKKAVSMLSSSLLILVPWMQVRHSCPSCYKERIPLALALHGVLLSDRTKTELAHRCPFRGAQGPSGTSCPLQYIASHTPRWANSELSGLLWRRSDRAH